MSEEKADKVFVIIVTYNAEKWIDKCLGSLRESLMPVNVIVIDNQSSDNTVSRIQSGYPEVNLIESANNLGFGKANNLGITRAFDSGADYVFLLNQDAWILPETLKVLIAVHKRNPKYFILSPVHIAGNGGHLDSSFSTYLSPYHCKDLISDYILKRDLVKDVYSTNFVNAAFWLLSRKCISTTGIFDPIFPHYGEDNDFIHRVMYHGGEIGICTGAYGYHDRPQDFVDVKKMTLSKRLNRQKVNGLITTMNINRSLYHCFMVFLRNWMADFFSSFMKLRLKEAFVEIRVFLFVLFNLSVIVKRRKVNKLIWRPHPDQEI